MNRFWTGVSAVIGLLGLTSPILAQDANSIIQKEKNRIGKYICILDKSVGIQYPVKSGDKSKPVYERGYDFSNGFAGQIKMEVDKFFVDLEQNYSDVSCKLDEMNLEVCEKKYLLRAKEFNGAPQMSYGNNTYNFWSWSGQFYLYDDNRFSSVINLYPNSYISHGRCEKIT